MDAVACVELEFGEEKRDSLIPVERVPAAIAAGHFVWVNVDFAQVERARDVLLGLGLVNETIIDDALTGEPATQSGRYDDYIHLVLTGCRLEGTDFKLDRVDAVMGAHFLLTIHKGPVSFVEGIRRSYRADFYRFARSPSFLVYELWDHLIENYLHVQKRFEHLVEKLQTQLITHVDDSVFSRLSELGSDLLHFRQVLVPARGVLTDLSTRKSLFVSEATQPFLANMVGTVERVLGDLVVNRDILSESLNLYISMVGYRTNKVMNKLTLVSVIFLPLTFLCGVYGMNFHVLPELTWKHGYLYFWIAVAGIVSGVIYFLRRNKLL